MFVTPKAMNYPDYQDAKTAIAYLGGSLEHGLSIKIRPVRWMNSELVDAYVYQREYEDAFKVFAHPEVVENIGMGDRAVLLRGDGGTGMLIKHETGPELILIAQLGLAAAFVGLAKEAIPCIRDLIKAISDYNERRKLGDTTIRHFEADYIAVELRRPYGVTQLIGGARLPLTKSEIDQLIKESLERAKRGEVWEGFPDRQS